MVAGLLPLRRAWRGRSWLSQVSIVAAVTFVASLILALRWDVGVDVGSLQVLVGAAYFLFGVFVAFALDSARTRMAKVNDLLKVDEANLLALHELAQSLGPETGGHMRELLDRHLQDQIDYRLVHFHLSAPSHLAILRFTIDLARGKGSDLIREQMLTLALQTNANRTQVETSTGHTLSRAEWMCIFGLLLLLLVSLPLFDTGTVWGAFIVAILGTILAAFVAILWNVDHLRWQEDTWIWAPLHRLFQNLGLLPYYPRVVVTERRAKVNGRVRLVDYPNPYPDISGKVVSIEEIGH